MLTYIVKTTLCWTLFFLLYQLLLRKETFFRVNRLYLIGTILLGLVIPAIDVQWLFQSGGAPAIVNYLQPVTSGVYELEAVIITASAEKTSFDWTRLLLLVYFAGAAVAAGRFLYGLSSIWTLYRSGEQETLPDYKYITTKVPHVPFSFFNNLFWSNSFQVDEVDRQNIMRHEEAHIYQRHSIDVMLIELLGIVFWCSPLVYFYKKAVKTTHEYLADDYVVARASRKKYGRLLLRQSQSGMQIAISNSLFSSQLKNRIVMITKNKSSKNAALKYLAGLPLLALLFLAFSFKSSPVSLATPQDTVVIDTLPDGDVLKKAEVMPRFPGCEEIAAKEDRKKCAQGKLLEFVYKNMKYPEEARKNGVEGISVVRFVIEKDGSITNIETVRSIGGGCDEAVRDIVAQMPNWVPGEQGGVPVRVQFNLPVKFALENGGAEGKSGKADAMPLFAGCEDASDPAACSQEKMVQFIVDHLKYPKVAMAAGTEGMVVAKFIVGKDGYLNDIEIQKSVSPECDAEVLRVMGAMPQWTPGMKKGKPVDTELALPFLFKIPEQASGRGAMQFAGVETFEISPNPASGKEGFRVRYKTEAGPVRIIVYNMLGKELASERVNNYDGTEQTASFNGLFDSNARTEAVIVSIIDDSGAILKSEKVMIRR